MKANFFGGAAPSERVLKYKEEGNKLLNKDTEKAVLWYTVVTPFLPLQHTTPRPSPRSLYCGHDCNNVFTFARTHRRQATNQQSTQTFIVVAQHKLQVSTVAPAR